MGPAVICVVAGVTAVARTRRATRADEDEYGVDDETTYAEEAAAVAAAQKAAAEAAAARAAEPEEPLL